MISISILKPVNFSSCIIFINVNSVCIDSPFYLQVYQEINMYNDFNYDDRYSVYFASSHGMTYPDQIEWYFGQC